MKNMRSTLLTNALAFCICICISSESKQQEGDFDENANDIFTWFDGLGFQAFGECPFVEVSSEIGEEATEVYGFLINHDPENKTSQVLTLELVMLTVDGQDKSVVERSDLTRHCEKILAQGHRIFLPWYERSGLACSQTFFLARACQANGEADLCEKLLELTAERYKFVHGKDAGGNLKQMLSESLGFHVFCEIMSDFGDVEVPRQLLYERLSQFKNNFPDSRYLDDANELTDQLEEMFAQEKEYEKLEVREEVNDLIFRLRDQTGFRSVFSNRNDLEARKDLTPAEKLLEIGLPAVPQLIEAFEDNRLSRVLDSNLHSLSGPDRILRVGECVKQILLHISKGQLFENKSDVEAWLERELKSNSPIGGTDRALGTGQVR